MIFQRDNDFVWHEIRETQESIQAGFLDEDDLIRRLQKIDGDWSQEFLREVIHSAGEYQELEDLRSRFEETNRVLENIFSFENNAKTTLNRVFLENLAFQPNDFTRIASELLKKGLISEKFTLNNPLFAYTRAGMKNFAKLFLKTQDTPFQQQLLAFVEKISIQRAREALSLVKGPISKRLETQFIQEYLRSPLTFAEFQRKMAAAKDRGESYNSSQESALQDDKPPMPSEEQVQQIYEQYFRISDEKLRKLRRKRDLVPQSKEKPEEDDLMEKIEFKKKHDDAKVDSQKRKKISKKKELSKEEYEQLREKIKKRLGK